MPTPAVLRPASVLGICLTALSISNALCAGTVNKGAEYSDFIRTGNPGILVRLLEQVPLSELVTELAARERPGLPTPIDSRVIFETSQKFEILQPLALSDDPQPHILLRRMTAEPYPGSSGSAEAWRNQLVEVIADGSAGSPSIIEDLFGDIADVRLLMDDHQRKVVVFSATNGLSEAQRDLLNSESNIYVSTYDHDRWSAPQPLLARATNLRGADAAYDSLGRLHVTYSAGEPTGSVVRELVIEPTGSRHDEVIGDWKPAHAINPQIVQVDPELIAIACRSDDHGARLEKYLLSHSQPLFVAGDVAPESMVARPGNGAIVVTMDDPYHSIVWWSWRDHHLSTMHEWTVSNSDLLSRVELGVVAEGEAPLFVLTRFGRVHLLRRRNGRIEVAPLFAAAGTAPERVRALATLRGEILELMVSDQSALRRLRFNIRQLRWGPFERERWLDVLGRGLAIEDESELQLLVRRAWNRSAGEQRIGLGRVLERDFQAGDAAKELEMVCASSNSVECVGYRERRDSLECAGGLLAYGGERCRAYELRATAGACAAPGDQTERCIRWRYETGRELDPFLRAAFDAERSALKSISPGRRRAAQSELESFRDAAVNEQGVQLGPWFGGEGFPLAAQLLRDRDPRVRSAAAYRLFDFDVLRATPFLIGLLTDCDWRERRTPSDVSPNIISVCGTARGLLNRYPYFDWPDALRQPLDDDSPLAKERAFQRFVAAHYRAHHQPSSGGAAFFYFRAIALELDLDALEAKRRALAGEICNLVRFDLEFYKTLHFHAGDPIDVSLVFRNLGVEDVSIRYDLSDPVHKIRLIDADGAVQMPRTEAFSRFSTEGVTRVPGDLFNNAEFQKGASGTGTIDWRLDLSQLFDVVKPGRYVLRYDYLPSWPLEPAELSRAHVFNFWNGREYVSEFAFQVDP